MRVEGRSVYVKEELLLRGSLGGNPCLETSPTFGGFFYGAEGLEGMEGGRL